MEIEKINKLKMSLMLAESNVNDKDKTVYLVKNSGTFNFSSFSKEEKTMLGVDIITAVFNNLKEEAKNEEVDSLGVWIDYEDKIFENSIKLDTLNDMENLGSDDVNSVYEFVKMSIAE